MLVSANALIDHNNAQSLLAKLDGPITYVALTRLSSTNDHKRGAERQRGFGGPQLERRIRFLCWIEPTTEVSWLLDGRFLNGKGLELGMIAIAAS